MKGLNRAAAVFLAGAAMVAIPAQAQQAGIQISVVDAVSGAPAADTEVVIENPGTGFRRVARTDAQGLLRLEGLTTSGQFRISTAASAAYDATEPQSLTLRSNFSSSITLRLTPVGQTITVTGARTVVGLNAVNAEVSA
jgi:hypothetical protein